MATIRYMKDRVDVNGINSIGVRIRKRFTRAENGPSYKAMAEEVYKAMILESTGLRNKNVGIKHRNFQSMTVKDLCERYVNEHLSKTRAKGNSSYLHMITAKYGNMKLCMVSIDLVRPWILTLFHTYSGYSVKKVCRYFIRVYNWGCEASIIEENPLQYLIDVNLVKQFKRTCKPRKVILDAADFEKLIQAMPVWLQRCCIASWCTGMRSGEVAKLRISKIRDMIATFEATETKEADDKSVVIGKRMRDMIRDIEIERMISGDESAYVFLSKHGKPLNSDRISTWFRHWADKANFEHVRFHDLRRSFINRLSQKGIDIHSIGLLVGHHAAQTTDGYLRKDASIEALKDAVEDL